MCILGFTLFMAGNALSQQKPMLKEGDDFPDIVLASPGDSHVATYLGVDKDKGFTVSDLKSDVVLVEVMNVNCHSCRKQAHVYNKLYDLIESNPETKGRIKMLAIAVGSQDVYIKEFADEFKTLYPVLQDSTFSIYDAVGGGPIPRSFLVRLEPKQKRATVAGIYEGFDADYAGLFENLRTLMNVSAAGFRERGKKTEAKVAEVKPILTQSKLEKKVRSAFSLEGDGLDQFQKVTLDGGKEVYTSVVTSGGVKSRLFAVVASHAAPCDVCHDVHFIYVFDKEGKILRLIPLQLTKYGNKKFNDSDLEKTRSRIVGRYLTGPFEFDAGVDAVSGATITSSVIFKSLNEGLEVYKGLKKKGLI
jgi:hypothetical protein